VVASKLIPGVKAFKQTSSMKEKLIPQSSAFYEMDGDGL
jgi:hypothetical protein